MSDRIMIFESTDDDNDTLYVNTSRYDGQPNLLFRVADQDFSKASRLMLGDIERLHSILGTWLAQHAVMDLEPQRTSTAGVNREDVCVVVASAFAALASHSDHMAHLAGPFAHPVYDGISRIAMRTANDPTWHSETKDGGKTSE